MKIVGLDYLTKQQKKKKIFIKLNKEKLQISSFMIFLNICF